MRGAALHPPRRFRRRRAMRIGRVVAASGWLLASASAARAWESPVPDVVLYCTHPLTPACQALARAYAARSGTAVHVFAASPNGVAGLLAHRARADVVVADGATVDGLVASHLAKADTRTRFGADPFVLARAPGSAARLPAATVLLPDPTSAASFDGAAVLRDARMAATAQGVADTPDVVSGLRRDRSVLGLLTATDAAGAGLETALRVEAPPMAVAGAAVTLRQSRNAEAFLRFAASADGRAVLARAGLETGS